MKIHLPVSYICSCIVNSNVIPVDTQSFKEPVKIELILEKAGHLSQDKINVMAKHLDIKQSKAKSLKTLLEEWKKSKNFNWDTFFSALVNVNEEAIKASIIGEL